MDPVLSMEFALGMRCCYFESGWIGWLPRCKELLDSAYVELFDCRLGIYH